MMKNIFSLVMIGFIYPFKSSKLMIFEYFNELVLQLGCYHLLCFTSFVQRPEDKYNMGYSLDGVVLFGIGMNIFGVVFTNLM